MRNKRIFIILPVVALILLLPLLAMQFTDELVWDLTDFVVAGALLFGACLTYELVARKTGNFAYRAAVGFAVAGALFLVWANLAVGLIGSEDNPANLAYVGVLAVGIIGAIITRLRPSGMARVLFATALAQTLVTIIALITAIEQHSSSSMSGTVRINILFVILWVGSALLFRRASDTGSKRY